MNPPLRGALVGLGNVALNGHLPAWAQRSDFKIVAGVDSRADRHPLFKKVLPESLVFNTLEECLAAGPLDFVDVAVPPFAHFELAKKALEKNLHVLCEKPLVFRRSEFDVLSSLARERKKVLFTVHNWKFAPLCAKLGELLRSGAVGTVERLEWYVLRSGPAVAADKENWRLNPDLSGGGVLVDHGWHAFYLVMGWLGLRPARVSATLEKRQYGDLPVEDTAKVRIEFGASGAPVAEIFLTWASRLRRNAGVVEGSSGRIQIEDDALYLARAGSPSAPEAIRFQSPLSQGSHHPDWFGAVIGEFADEVSGRVPTGTNLEQARLCLALIEQSKASSEKGASLPVE